MQLKCECEEGKEKEAEWKKQEKIYCNRLTFDETKFSSMQTTPHIERERWLKFEIWTFFHIHKE